MHIKMLVLEMEDMMYTMMAGHEDDDMGKGMCGKDRYFIYL